MVSFLVRAHVKQVMQSPAKQGLIPAGAVLVVYGEVLLLTVKPELIFNWKFLIT